MGYLLTITLSSHLFRLQFTFFFDSLASSASPSPYQFIDNNANFYISTEHIQNVGVRFCNKRHTDRLEKKI